MGTQKDEVLGSSVMAARSEADMEDWETVEDLDFPTTSLGSGALQSKRPQMALSRRPGASHRSGMPLPAASGAAMARSPKVPLSGSSLG